MTSTHSDPKPPQPPPAKPTRTGRVKRASLWTLLGVVLVCGATHWSQRAEAAESPAKKASPAIPVLATTVVRANLDVHLAALGTVTPFAHVVVKSRVDGQLTRVHFEEGQWVKEGDLLAEIDPRPYEVKVTQAEGQWLRNLASLKNAKLDLERYAVLWEQRAISKQAWEAQEAVVTTHEGTVKSDEAAVEEAKLNLAYTKIVAPISGRVGFRQVDAGNLIRSSEAVGLVTITQTAPITVVFTVGQDHVSDLVKKVQAGETLTVEALDRERKAKLAEGRLLTLNNEIDENTGTLKCKAVFENRDGELFPNQFVNVRMRVETRKDVVQVPMAAIQRGAQQSTFVYVVESTGGEAGSGKGDTVAKIRTVKLGSVEGGNVEVLEGLEAGAWVVLEGVDRLQDGTRVQMKTLVGGGGSGAQGATVSQR